MNPKLKVADLEAEFMMGIYRTAALCDSTCVTFVREDLARRFYLPTKADLLKRGCGECDFEVNLN